MTISGSKRKLLDLMKRQGPVSIGEASRQTGLAKTTLREHLLQLERDDFITRDFIRSGPGRPVLQYSLTSRGHSIYPSREGEMLRELLSFLEKEGQIESIREFFQLFWDKREERARELMKQIPKDDEDRRVEVLAKMLEKEGFMPEYQWDAEQDQILLKECNCPFREVVRETKLPCHLEMEFYQKMFGRTVERETYIADGDSSCTYRMGEKICSPQT